MEYNMVVCTVCNQEIRNNKWLIDSHQERNHKDKIEKGHIQFKRHLRCFVANLKMS